MFRRMGWVGVAGAVCWLVLSLAMTRAGQAGLGADRKPLPAATCGDCKGCGLVCEGCECGPVGLQCCPGKAPATCPDCKDGKKCARCAKPKCTCEACKDCDKCKAGKACDCPKCPQCSPKKSA